MKHSYNSTPHNNSMDKEALNLGDLQAFFKKDSDIELVILFGSLAVGNYTAESDIDLAIKKNEPLSEKQKMRLIEQIALITGRAVDLVDLSSVGEPLLGQILKYGQRLQGSDSHFAELGLKHVYAQADFVPFIERTLRERRQQWLANSG